MSDIFYPATTNPVGYLRKHFPGLPHILGDLTSEGFPVTVPAGVDWADFEPQPDLVTPQPDLRIPRDPWEYWREQYPEAIGNSPQPTPEQVANWVPEVVEPEPPAPVTDVEIATGNFKRAREAAPEALDRLKGAVWAALLAGGMAPDEATAAGVGLVLLHGPLLAAFEAAGGHPVAAQALYAAIASEASVTALPWLTAPILAIFSAALTPGK